MATTQPPCVGCLGSKQCWVCLGTGNRDTQRRTGVCSRCGGDGVCTVCRSQPAVIVLPEQEERSTPPATARTRLTVVE